VAKCSPKAGLVKFKREPRVGSRPVEGGSVFGLSPAKIAYLPPPTYYLLPTTYDLFLIFNKSPSSITYSLPWSTILLPLYAASSEPAAS
jgi:hypothetical protein